MKVKDEFLRISKHCETLKTTHGPRVEMQDAMVDAFLLKWDEEKATKDVMEGVKITLSPDIRNRILGAVRLLIATAPQFKLSSNLNVQAVMDISSTLEEIALRMFNASGFVMQEPCHYEAVMSAILHDEVHILIDKSEDYLDTGTEVDKFRSEQIAYSAPYTYNIVDPRKGFPEYDNRGIRTYTRHEEYCIGEIVDMFGEDIVAKNYKGYKEEKRNDKKNLWQHWDYIWRYAWLDGAAEFMIKERHGLPFLPVSTVIGSAWKQFEKEEDRRQPFAYTVWKSGIWNRQNLALTVAYTNLFKMGASPAISRYANEAGQKPKIEFENGVNFWDVPRGAKLEVEDLSKIVNKDLVALLQLADSKVEESTIYSQTLGEPLGANAPFSMVALLHQAGRLPLLVPQLKAGFVIADAVFKTMVWSAKEGFDSNDYEHIFGDFKISDIPEHFAMNCKLDVALPQDDMQNATIAKNLRGDDAIVTREYIQSNIMNIENAEKMNKAIQDEKGSDLRFEYYVAEELNKIETKRSETSNMQLQRIIVEQAIQSGQIPPEMAEQVLAGLGVAPEEGVEGAEVPIPGTKAGPGIADTENVTPEQDPNAVMPPVPSASTPDATKGRGE